MYCCIGKGTLQQAASLARTVCTRNMFSIGKGVTNGPTTENRETGHYLRFIAFT